MYLTRGNKRGQVAIFIIIAVIIASIILLFVFRDNIPEVIQERAFTPQSYLKDCIEPKIKPIMESMSEQGGTLNPVGTYSFNGTNVKYLCYTAGWYKTCTVQEPMLPTSFESELNGEVQSIAKECAADLVSEYQRQGFSVSSGQATSNTTLSLDSVNVKINFPITVTKETSQTFTGFDIRISSNIYQILAISQSIVEYEATYGDSETTLYLAYYPNINIQKIKMSDGNKIYIVYDVTTNERFVFASRSLSWPPGYATP